MKETNQCRKFHDGLCKYTQADIDEIHAALDRARLAKAINDEMLAEVERRGLATDYAFIDKLARTVKETTGVTHEDEQLLAEVEQARFMREVVKAEMAAQQPTVTSSVPEGYGENVGTDTTQVFISLPVEIEPESAAESDDQPARARGDAQGHQPHDGRER